MKMYCLFYFLIQFYVPFKIISAHMRRTNQKVGQKRENPAKNRLTHPQAELGLPVSHVARAGIVKLQGYNSSGIVEVKLLSSECFKEF